MPYTRITMAKEQPRIYTYKITFEEVSHYYYGVHKEKRFGEEYWGSPVTHKWMWDFYTPQKQVLELFDFSDEGYTEAEKVEKRLIRPVFNTDPLCLNENCGGRVSLEVCRRTAQKNRENGTGIFKLTKEQRSDGGKKAGNRHKENGTGVCAMTLEERRRTGKISGEMHKRNKTGVCGRTKEQMSADGKKGMKTKREKKLGLFSLTSEDLRKNVAKTNAQRWQCIVTGYVSTPAGLTRYQTVRGIDTKNRIRLE